MARASKFHLEDEEGRPLPDHIVDAVGSLERKLFKQFGTSCDPAVLSNKIEAGARSTARHEERNGPLADVKGFLYRTVTNLVISHLRSRPKEEFVDDAELERLAGPAPYGPDQILHYVQARETLETMSHRDQRLCWLQSQGVSARDIGRELGMSEENVWTTLSRIRRATRKTLTKKRATSDE